MSKLRIDQHMHAQTAVQRALITSHHGGSLSSEAQPRSHRGGHAVVKATLASQQLTRGAPGSMAKHSRGEGQPSEAAGGLNDLTIRHGHKIRRRPAPEPWPSTQ